MEDLVSSINNAKSLDELLSLMAGLSRKVESMVNGGRLARADIQRLVLPLARIRSLLTILSVSALPGRSEAGALRQMLVRGMADRFLDMEGRIKKIRNDLSRGEKSLSP